MKTITHKIEKEGGVIMDYRKTAQEILGYVGGSKNIVSAAHCATRLRLVIADNSKADKEAIENVDGVKGVFEASGQLQIILGTGIVNKVYEYALSKNYKTLTIDGVKVLFDDGFALVRASNTGPNITARFEAKTEERLKIIEKEFIDLLNQLLNK